MRDDFSKITKEILAKRVSFKCSNPNCKKITVGAHSIDDKIINLGVACHITAAAKGGPRFCKKITQEQRKSIQNGIWLCQNCAKLIDTDINKYSYNELIKWKSLAEKESLSVITSDYTLQYQNSSLFDKRILAYEKLYNEIKEVDILLRALIHSKEMSIQEKKDAAFYLGLQIAQFTDDNSFYLQDEVTAQCVGTFVGVEDFFPSNSEIGKASLANYNKNIRASQELLKSVNEKGLIDTSKKTALMSGYSELKSEQNDFL
ncbi:MAG: hypothetical protein LBT43_19795 [Prevotella sp.]|jgi:hypothetical protein|nr:hypothetical protein [Prevotella sp.]